MAPNQYGSSTMGVKKSAVRTMAVSSEMRYTPASSAFADPTSTFGSDNCGKCPRTWDKSAGLNFAAQPAQLERCVSLISMITEYIVFAENVNEYFVTRARHRGAAGYKTSRRMPLTSLSSYRSLLHRYGMSMIAPGSRILYSALNASASTTRCC